MRKVLIGTPCHDGKTEVWYNNSLNGTIRQAMQLGIDLHVVYLSYESLVQVARNDLMRLALYEKFHDLIFIDADQEWSPEWVFKLLSLPVDVIGAPVIKKADFPAFNVKALPGGVHVRPDGLAEVECVGTGFMRISNRAMRAVWNDSEKYRHNDKQGRWVFDVKPVDGDLISEDNIFCHKWRKLGGKVFIDPSMTCGHVGAKKYTGNFLNFLQQLKPHFQ